MLLAKKRYVGFSYESPAQAAPVFDAKGIETVRRDTCGAVAKMMERSIRILFATKDLSQARSHRSVHCPCLQALDSVRHVHADIYQMRRAASSLTEFLVASTCGL